MIFEDEGYFNPIDDEAIESDTDVEEVVEGEESPEETEETEETDGEETTGIDEPGEDDDDPIGNIVGDWIKNQSTESQAPRGEEMEILSVIHESDLIKELIKLKREGRYSDEQIKRGLGSTYWKMYGDGKQSPQQQQEESEELDLSDPRVLASFIQQQVQSALIPFEQKNQQKEYLSTAKQTQEHNDKVLYGSLVRIAKKEQAEEDDIKRIKAVFQNMYPGFDATKYQLTQAQADLIMAAAFSKGKNATKKSNTMNNMKAPAIPSGKATSTMQGTPNFNTKKIGLTQTERAENFKKLF